MVATIGEVRLKVSLDRSGIRSGLDELRQIQTPNIALKPKVDFSELHELNRLFDVKIAHANQLQKSLVFKPRVDATELKKIEAAANQLRDVSINVRIVDNATASLRQIADTAKRLSNLTITPRIDQTALNRDLGKLGQKQLGIKVVARIAVDRSEVDRIKVAPIVIGARVAVDRSELGQLANQTIKIRTKFDAAGNAPLFDASKISTELTAAISKGFSSSKGINFGDLLLAPLKGAINLSTGIAGRIGGGLINGITEPITAGLGKGLSTAIETSIAPSVGSSELFANKVGSAIGATIVDAAKLELIDLNDAIQNSIDNIDNGRVRRKLQSVLDAIKEAPGNINQAVQETIGQDNITRQNLLNDRRSQQQTKRDDRQVQAQAQDEFDTAKANVRRLSKLPQTSEVAAEIDQNIAVAEIANQFRPRTRQLPDQYLQVAKAVAGKDVDLNRLPSLEVDDVGLDQLGANAGYDRESNTIKIRESLKQSIEQANLSNEQIRTLAEELSHAYDLDFGSERGLEARARGQVLPDRRLEGTPEELRKISPELSRYNEADRGFELNGKIRAERATATVLVEKQQREMLRLIGDIRESADLQPLINEYKKIIGFAEKLGVNLGGSLREDFLAIENLASSTIGAVAAGDFEEEGLIAAIGELNTAFNALDNKIAERAKLVSNAIADRQIARSLAAPWETGELPEGSTERLINQASQGDRRQLERMDGPLDAAQVTPRRTAYYGPDDRAYQFEDEAQRRKRENSERVAARREQFKQDVISGVKAAPGKVRDFVFNADRNIDIDVDALRDRVEKTGVVLYNAGLFTAKALDATAKTFNQLAASPAGKFLLSAGGDTAKALGAAAKASYALAAGVESITLDLIPAGRTLKAGLKQTAVPALAFGAATQLLPGGQAIAGAGIDFAQAALGPVGGAISGNLIGGANQALSALPEAFGLQAHAIEAVTSLITSATQTITAGVAEIAVPVLGGKLITGSIGKALPPSLSSQQAALPPSQQPFQLPFAPQSRKEAITVDVIGSNDIPKALSAGGNKATPSIGGEIVPRSGAIVPKAAGDLNKARSEANAAAARAGEIASAAVNSAKLVARTTEDIVASAKEIQARVSAGYSALKDAIAGGNKGLARALQESIVDVTAQAQTDLEELLDEARKSGDRKALTEIGRTKGRINRNLNSTTRLDRKVEAIDISAEDITGEGLARAAGEKTPGIFAQLKDRLNAVLPLTEKRLAAVGENYERIIQAISDVSDATIGFDGGDITPGLRVADLALKELGAEAFYDAENNVILVNKELAKILASGPEELKKYAEKLRPLVQEGRHALQLVGGGLDIETAATGANVTLDRGDNLTKADRAQVERSVKAARGNASPDAVRRLETDALAFESQTAKVIDLATAEARKQAAPAAGKLDGVKQRFEELRDAITDRVFGLIGQAKTATAVSESKALIQIGLKPKATEQQQPLTAEDDAAIADRLAKGQVRAQRQADLSKSEIDTGKRASRRALDADESFRAAERQIARQTGGTAPIGTVSLREDADETIGLFSGIKNVVKSFNDRLAEELKKTSGILAEDASQTVLEIRNSRIKAENAGDRATAKRLGGLEQRAESAIGGIDALRDAPLTDPAQREKLRGLRDEIASVYSEIQRPLPVGAGDGLLGVGDQIGGLIGKFKGLGATLLALPFAFEALQGLKQFGKDAVVAAVNYDRLRTSLANSSGSAKAADRDLAFIANQAQTFGTDLKTGREGFTGLRASTKGTSIEGKATEDLFAGVTQASTVLGLSGEAQNKAFLALQQTASKGKLSAEELRGQLAEALPGAFGVAARAIGVTEAELNKLLETGAITSDEFLPKFGRQLQAEFGGSAVEASNNLQSSLFRVDAAFLKLQESSGAAIGPAVKVGADATAGALGLLEKSIGIVGPALALLSGKVLIEFGAQLLKIPAVAKTAAIGLNGLKESALAIGKSLGPIAALSLAVYAAGKVFEGLKETFDIDPSVSAFKSGTAQIASDLDTLVGKADKTGKALSNALGKKENKGLDLTFGAGEALGFGKFKTDDLVDKTRSKNLGDRAVGTALAIAGGPITQILAATGFKSSEFAAKREAKANQEALANVDKISNTIDEENSGKLRTDALKKAKEIDDRAAAIRTNIAKLQGQPGKETEVAKQRDQLRQLDKERKDAIAPADEQQQKLAGTLRELTARRKALEEAPPSAARTKALDEIDQRADRVRKQLEKLRQEEISVGVNVDPIRKLVTTLADLEDKLASIEEKANLTLNIKLADNSREALAGFGGNQFASQDAAEKDAKAQAEKAKAIFEQSRSEIEKAQKDLSSEDATRALSQIAVGNTGRVISLNSSEEDIKTASKGATGQQKELLERVDNFRKVREKLPTLDRESSQSELAAKQATQASALARVDDTAETRSQSNAQAAASRQIALNRQLVSNTIKSDEELAIKRAALEQQSVADRASAVQAQIASLEELRSQGTISAEEYVKRRRALANEEVSIAADASNAEVSIKQAANAKILKDLERASRDRNLKSKVANNAAQIQLTKDDLNPNISEEKLAVKSAQVNLEGTRSELANAKAELEGLNKAFAAGALNQEQYNDKAADLKGTISDLGVKQAQGELAVRKAINAELLKEYDRAKATRELNARVANNQGRSALLSRQLRGGRKLESEDVAIESARLDSAATDRQTANAKADLADLNAQFAKGLIKVGEFEDKSKELKGTLSDLGVQKLTNELAILEAQNAKTLKSFERLNAEANAKLDRRQFARSFGARQSQFLTGQITGEGGAAEQSKIERQGIAERIKLRTAEIAGVKRLVQQRVLTESEGRDRILGIEADIRGQRMSLLDAEIADFERVKQAEIDLINRTAEAQAAAFDAEKTLLSNRSTLLEKQSSILSALAEQEKAVSDARIGELSSRESNLGNQRQLAQRLNSDGTGENERREILRQTGGQSELTILKNQQAVAREIEAEKVATLDRQQAFARAQLKQEQERLRIAQKIAELEAKSAQVRAVSAAAAAKVELSKAERTGDKNQIAAAKSAVDAADLGVALATENVGLTQALGGAQEKELATRAKTLEIQQKNERSDLFRQNQAAENGRRIEFAQTLDRTGERGFFGDFAVAGSAAQSRGEVKVEPIQIADSIGQLSTNISNLNLTNLEALLKKIAENTTTSNKPPVVNNFNGGQDAVQQYNKLKNAEYAAAARNS